MTYNDINYKELFTFGWEKTKQHYWFLLGLFAINILISVITSHAQFLSTVFSFLMTIATVSVLLEIVAGRTPHYRDLLKPFKNYKITWHYFLGMLLIMLGFLVGAGIFALFLFSGIAATQIAIGVLLGVLLIATFVYAAVRLQFFRYFVLEDENLGPIHAFKKSIAVTHGRFWELFGFLCLIALFNLIGLVLLVIGLLVTIPVSLIAYTHLYKKLTAHHTAA